jgi:pimeloyl-ACP methyl ester carboxylesterase
LSVSSLGRLIAAALSVPLLAGALCLIPSRPLTRPPHEHPAVSPVVATARFEEYLEQQLQRSRREGVRPGNEERLTRRGPERAPVVILFVHGFGASRAEGEAVVDQLAAELAATVYYTRLPGHGGSLEAQAAARTDEYFARLEEDFHRLRPLGEKLVLIGSSTGALLCVWLAARHPDDVAALILASPLLAYADPLAFLLSRRVGMPIIEALYGPIRDASWPTDPEGRKQSGYEDHWITRQRFRAMLPVDDLRRIIAVDETARAVRAPVELLYYYADPHHQDSVVSVPAMLDFFKKTSGGHPHPLSRQVAIADGNHILLSQYVRTDKQKILEESRQFLQAVLKSSQR